MSDPTHVTNYTNVMLKFPDSPYIYADGIKIGDEQKTTSEHHGASDDAFQVTPGVHDLTYEIVNARDHGYFYSLAEKCRQENYSFPLIVLAQNVITQDWDVLEVLSDCYQNTVPREMGSHKHVTPTVKGIVFSRDVRTTEFD